jgi:hypothetical protein
MNLMIGIRPAIARCAQILTLLTFALSAQAGSFDFSYSLPPGSGSTPFSVTASGTFTTSAFDGTSYTITDITGTWNGFGITGLLAPGTFGGNDNLLFPSSPFLSVSGVAFTVAGPGDDEAGQVNLYFDGESYTENTTNVGGTAVLAITPRDTASVPEPNSFAFAIVGLLGVTCSLRVVSRSR